MLYALKMDYSQNNSYQQMAYGSQLLQLTGGGGGVGGGATNIPQQSFDYGGGAAGGSLTNAQLYYLSPYTPELEADTKILMQTNGRKILGPPEDWIGPPPTNDCELFVRRIPKDINEQLLIQQFLRFGKIYEIRLPMDFNQASRGYCYVKYTSVEDASRAMEVLSHFFVAPQKKLEILHSSDKCSLFVGNIPKNITEQEVELKLRCLFPNMERVYAPRKNYNNNNGNGCGSGSASASSSSVSSTNLIQHDLKGDKIYDRGCAIIQFPTHIQALEAKKCITPGLVRMWGRDLKVVWANKEREQNNRAVYPLFQHIEDYQTKTLFLRNVDLSVNYREIQEELCKYVNRSDINKVSRARASAFVEFANRDVAELCYKKLQGLVLCGKLVDVEWAKPPDEQSLHRLGKTDFDAVLRLKCIANNWQIPVIIYGAYFENYSFQYCTVMLRNSVGLTRAVFAIMQCTDLVDIQSRLCELVCLVIETLGVFPDYNYVFLVEKDDAHLLGMIAHDAQGLTFTASNKVPKRFLFDLSEIIDLSWAVAVLSTYAEQNLLQLYQNSFQTNQENTYLDQISVLGYRVFGTIHPNYRNKPPLKYDLNNSQIVLALCFISTGTNMNGRAYVPYSASCYDTSCEGFNYLTLKMLPNYITQSRHGAEHVINSIKFGSLDFYHPSQRMNSHSHVPACSYSIALRNVQPNYVMPACSYYTTYVQDYNLNPTEMVPYNVMYTTPSPQQAQQLNMQATQQNPLQSSSYHLLTSQSSQEHMLLQPQPLHYTPQSSQVDLNAQMQSQAQAFSQLSLHDHQQQQQQHHEHDEGDSELKVKSSSTNLSDLHGLGLRFGRVKSPQLK